MEDDPLLGTESKPCIQNNSPSTTDVDPQESSWEVDYIAKHKPKTDFSWHLALAMAACTLGSSFQFGYNSGVVNAPEKTLKAFYNQTDCNRHGCMSDGRMTFLWSITVAMFCIGGMMGGFSAGHWANKFGRKRTLLLNNILMVVGVATEFSSKYLKSYEVLIVGRLFIGINAGINTGVAPLYLSEISPVSLRGLCGTFNQLCITFGVLISEIMGLDQVFATDKLWQYCFAVPLVMVVWQLCTLSLCPESPRFLLIDRHSEEEARKALLWLRGTPDIKDEIEEMIAEREKAKHIKKFTIGDLIKSPSLRKPLKISLVMHLSQQFSGINAVIYYSTIIFQSAGLNIQQAQYATLATGAVNVSMTFVSALLMDRLGRRTLHLTGLGGLFVSSYILCIGLIFQEDLHWMKYLCILAVITYIVFFAIGPGAIPWFFVAELFSQGPRPAAVSVSVLTNWAANTTVAIVYPFLQDLIHAYSFVPFVVALGVFWMYTLYFVPETKGKTIEEITALFQTADSTEYVPIPISD